MTFNGFQAFGTKAKELLQEAIQGIQRAANAPDDQSSFDAAFRALTSIQAGAALSELTDLQNHVAQLTVLLSRCGSEKKWPSADVDRLIRGTQAIQKYLDGEKFSFDFGTQTDTIATARVDATRNNGHILIVDDEPDILSILQTLLEDYGFKTTISSDPRGVLSNLATINPDAILTDYKMPVMNGLQMATAIRHISPDLPIIFVSGFVAKDLLISLVQTGIYDVIEKPFEDKRIVQTCIGATQKHRILKLINRSIDLIMYQFADLDKFLQSSGKSDIRATLRAEIHNLLEQRRLLRQQTSKPVTAIGV